MKQILIILALFIGIVVTAQTNLYRLQFENETEALQLQETLSDTTLPYAQYAVDIRGRYNMTISKAYVNEQGDSIPAVIDERYFARVVTTGIDVIPELMPYVVDLDYWDRKYGGEDKWNIIKPE